MSSVCRCCGWACAAYIVGLPSASKKIEQSACGWLWVPRSAEKSPDFFFFRPKIRSADPESIARIRKFKLLILTQLRVLYPPRSADFFFFVLCPWSEVQSVIIRPNSATRFVPPKIGWDPSQPQDIGWKKKIVLSQGARFAHRSSDHEPSPEHWTHRQYGMFTATLLR